MKFNVVFRYIVSELTPGFLRKSAFVNFLYSLIKGLQDTNDAFYQKTEDIFYYLKFNAQVIYLEKYLNDQYDPVQRRINISQLDYVATNYLFNDAEAEAPFYLDNASEVSVPIYFFNNTPSSGSYNFLVNVPNTLSSFSNKITASVNLFNLADKTFNINLI